MRCSILALAAALLCTGCTTLSLRRQTLSHAESVADLRYREVMENLAMIYGNPAALPTHTSIFYGTTDVADTVPMNAGFAWMRNPATATATAFTSFMGASLDFPFQRQIKKNWTLDPTIVPEKMVAIRCACWWALFGPNHQLGDSSSLEKYAAGDPPGMYFDVADKLREIRPGWLCCGALSDAPLRTSHRARSGDQLVWVEPDGEHGLTQFTLVLQTIARTVCSSVTYPQQTTNAVVLDGGQFATTTPGSQITKVMVNVDADGYVTSAANVTSLPPKGRLDNIGNNADVKSSITAATH